MIGKRHKEVAQRGPIKGQAHLYGRHRQDELYKIPEGLIEEIFSSITL